MNTLQWGEYFINIRTVTHSVREALDAQRRRLAAGNSLVATAWCPWRKALQVLPRLRVRAAYK